MRVRFAEEKDAADLLKIYNQYIDTTITFEYVLPSEEEFQRRIRETKRAYPYLVCETDGQIIGYAYAHRSMERAAYQWNAELSVYLDRDVRGEGIGRHMYDILIALLKEQGVKNVYAYVTSPNPRSEAFHREMGFSKLGTYHSSGYKCGRWCDVLLFEKQITPYEIEPKPIFTIHEISEEVIRAILENGSKAAMK